MSKKLNKTEKQVKSLKSALAKAEKKQAKLEKKHKAEIKKLKSKLKAATKVKAPKEKKPAKVTELKKKTA